MTQRDLDRAALVLFAAREAGAKGSLDQMRAICICIRNRMRAGWEEGQCLANVEAADQSSAHDQSPFRLDPNHRPLQLMLREIDEIYYGDRPGILDDESASHRGLDSSLTQPKREAKYWCFVDRPLRDWFTEKIIRDPENHPNCAQLGLMMFYA